MKAEKIKIEFDYGTSDEKETTGKNIKKTLKKDFGLSVTKIIMNGPGGGFPCITAIGTIKNIENFYMSYSKDSGMYNDFKDFLKIHQIK